MSVSNGNPTSLGGHSATGVVDADSVEGPASRGQDGRLPHMPGLDGLRGLAVAAVVVYHGGFSFFVGGYLGVSTFFTLSGFLITGLLLVELRDHGRVSLKNFWTRRLRRLLPPILVTLAVVVVLFGRLVATADQRANMPGDVLSSLFDLANWHFILSGSGYGAQYADPSPVLHFWSLAIEEQFYLLFPLLLWGLWRVSRGRSAIPMVVLGALMLLSAGLPALFGMSVDRAYFGTDTRAAEMLIGALLAFVLFAPGVTRWWQRHPLARTVVAIGAAVAAAVQLWWWFTLPHSTGWLYRGGFLLYAIMTALIITAVVIGAGPMAHTTTGRVLRWLGTRSFAVYLIHWPLYLVVRQEFPTWSRWVQAAVVITLSLLIAEASFRWLESPIRSGRWPRTHAGRYALVGVVVVALLALVPLPYNESERTVDFDQALEQRQQTSPVAPVPPPQPAVVGEPPLPARLATFGDSTALLAALGLSEYSNTTADPLLLDVGGDVILGCGVSRFYARDVAEFEPLRAECLQWPDTWPQQVDTTQPDIAMLITGAWEVPDVLLPGSDQWSALGDPAVDAFVQQELNTAVDILSADGAMVLLVLWPPYATWAADGKTDGYVNQADPARMAVLHQMLRDIAAQRPDTTRVLDLTAWLGEARLTDRSIREDGMHIPAPVMAQLWQDGLAAEVSGIYTEWWEQRATNEAAAP